MQLAAGSGIELSLTPSGDTSVQTIALTATGVEAGVYTAATLSVDEQGRIVAIASNPLGEPTEAKSMGNGASLLAGKDGHTLVLRSVRGVGHIKVTETGNEVVLSAQGIGTLTSVDIAGLDGVTATGGPITTSGTFKVGLTKSGVMSGTYVNPTIKVDQYGRVTHAASVPVDDTTATNIGNGHNLYAGRNGKQLQLRTIVLGTGLIATESATELRIDLGLTDGVETGYYACADIEIDGRGRITRVRGRVRGTISTRIGLIPPVTTVLLSEEFEVIDAYPGWFVSVNPNFDLCGLQVSGFVSSNHRVKLRVTNPTSAPVTLESGAFEVIVSPF